MTRIFTVPFIRTHTVVLPTFEMSLPTKVSCCFHFQPPAFVNVCGLSSCLGLVCVFGNCGRVEGQKCQGHSKLAGPILHCPLAVSNHFHLIGLGALVGCILHLPNFSGREVQAARMRRHAAWQEELIGRMQAEPRPHVDMQRELQARKTRIRNQRSHFPCGEECLGSPCRSFSLPRLKFMLYGDP